MIAFCFLPTYLCTLKTWSSFLWSCDLFHFLLSVKETTNKGEKAVAYMPGRFTDLISRWVICSNTRRITLSTINSLWFSTHHPLTLLSLNQFLVLSYHFYKWFLVHKSVEESLLYAVCFCFTVNILSVSLFLTHSLLNLFHPCRFNCYLHL